MNFHLLCPNLYRVTKAYSNLTIGLFVLHQGTNWTTIATIYAHIHTLNNHCKITLTYRERKQNSTPMLNFSSTWYNVMLLQENDLSNLINTIFDVDDPVRTLFGWLKLALILEKHSGLILKTPRCAHTSSVMASRFSANKYEHR